MKQNEEVKDDYLKTYICTLGYWSPDIRDDAKLTEEYKKDFRSFHKKFIELLIDDIINTVKDTEIFVDVKFKKYNEDHYNMKNRLLLGYDPNEPINFIYFEDVIIECLINPERYEAMIKKNGNDRRIIEKLRNKIEEALFNSDFRDMRIEINLNDIKEFHVN